MQLQKERSASRASAQIDPSGPDIPPRVMELDALKAFCSALDNVHDKCLEKCVLVQVLPKKQAATNIFNSVIQKLEQQYMVMVLSNEFSSVSWPLTGCNENA